MTSSPAEHIHWKDLLVDSFPHGTAAEIVFPNNRLRVITRTDCHNGSRNQHDHDYFEIVLVRSGTASHISLHGEKLIRRGDVLILPPRVWHSYRNCRALEIFNCCIGEEIFRQYLPFHAFDPFWRTFFSSDSMQRQSQWTGKFRLPGKVLQEAEGTFVMLTNLTQEPFQFQTNYRLLGFLMLAFGQLADGLRDQVQFTATPAQIHPIVAKAMALINENQNQDWRVSELCRELNGVNPAYFIRLFKRQAGLTPKAYISRRRLELAAHRLLTSSDSVTEIAISHGWNDPNLFSRTFRQAFSASPTEYREARASEQLPTASLLRNARRSGKCPI